MAAGDRLLDGDGLAGVLGDVPVGAAIPHDHRPAPVLRIGDGALEAPVVERVIFDVHRQALHLGVVRGPLRHGPRRHHAGHLDPEVVVERPGVMLLHHEAQLAPTFRDRPLGLGGLREVTHTPVAVEPVGGHATSLTRRHRTQYLARSASGRALWPWQFSGEGCTIMSSAFGTEAAVALLGLVGLVAPPALSPAPARPAASPTWSVQSIPEPSGAFSGKLLGTTCASATSCFAVGWGSTTGSALGTLVEHWNGTSWAPQASPDPTAAGDVFPQLNAVTCTSVSQCTTVGTDFTLSNTAVTVVESWSGKAWTVVSSPNLTGATTNSLTGLSCISTSFCMAVGDATTTSPDVVSLAEQWNGSKWSIDTTPDPSGYLQTWLTSVACPTTKSCVAVGYAQDPGADVPIVEQWNGSTWSLRVTPIPSGSADNELSGVACPTASSCIAVGRTYASESAPAEPMAEKWNGTTWSVVTTPDPTDVIGAFLSSVSCPTSTTCEAAGESYTDNSGDTETLVEQLSAGSWALVPSPDEAGVTTSFLSAVACPPSSTSCVAAGQYYTPDDDHLLAMALKTGKWALTSVPGAGLAGASYLQGAACSTSACVAVGESFPTNDGQTRSVVEQWNGKAWALGASARRPAPWSQSCPAPRAPVRPTASRSGTPGSVPAPHPVTP